jgi:HAE1 family hydrophobic/amphiphilic exporter-1
VAGGLLFSQALTLYITPVIYIYMDGIGQWFAGGRRKPRPTSPSAEMPAE